MDQQIVAQVLEMAMSVQQVAAPTFAEGQRAAFVCARLLEEGLEAHIDQVGNVLARLPAGEAGAQQSAARPVIVSAHLDTVFPAGTDLSLVRSADKICGPGIGDNSMGVAGLFGLLWGLRQQNKVLPGDLWLVANVCEEGLGDLRGMKAVVERFGAEPRAYIVLEGMALGAVYHQGLGSRRYGITIRTQGGHSWFDYGRPSAVHELAGLIVRLQGLVLPARPRTSLNVGVVSGGISVNTIASEAHMEVDLRSESPETLHRLAAQVEEMAQAANRPGVDVRVEVIGHRPAGEIPAGHPLVQLSMRALEAQGIEPHLQRGSTDANIPLSLGLPAVCLGLTVGSAAHTTGEYIQTHPLASGLEQLLMVVENAYR